MDRRNFFKLVGTASGGLMTGACGKEGREIIPLLVPEEQIAPGAELWRPSVCQCCSAGCGTIVRIMQAERETAVEGERVRQRIAAVKKVEGNPLDPVSGGRLCARGQAAPQSLYHPDRLQGPRKRAGEPGEGRFESVSWEQALDQLQQTLQEADPRRILFLARPEASARSVTIARFLKALGAPPAATLSSGAFAVERKAALQAFGWDGLPVYEIQDATEVLSIGADFLGGWVSPVFYSRRYGHMRQGRPTTRGRLVHAEARFSQTAWSADEWLPVQPGGEQALALAIGNVLVREGEARGLDSTPEEVRKRFEEVDFERAAAIAGIPAERIRREARRLSEAEAPVVVAGASIVRTNSLAAVTAANCLNLLLGNIGQKGGVMHSTGLGGELAESRPETEGWLERLGQAEVILIDGVNPAYAAPHTAERLAAASVISFSPLLDDSAAFADLILPAHDPLESAAAVAPEVAPGLALTASEAFVRPLYDTKAVEEVLAAVSEQLGSPIEAETPRKSFEALFERRNLEQEWESAGEFADHSLRRGGWWEEFGAAHSGSPTALPAPLAEPELEGSADEFPLRFQAYPTVQFGDGDGAHLPWLQETPDPASSAMWGLPVEVDPGTARQLGLRTGSLVRVTSPGGAIEAPVYVNPAAVPGVVSMPIGQGHTHYGRYASGRGANPLKLTGKRLAEGTGAPAFGSVRVRLEKISDSSRLVQFQRVDREMHGSHGHG